MDLRSIDHVYKNQFGKHLDKLVRRETQCCCLMLLLLSRSYCYCYCPGAGGNRRPLQKHIAGSSPPWEDSLKKLWLGEEKTLQKSDDEAHTVCLWLWQVWHTVCHTANWKQGPGCLQLLFFYILYSDLKTFDLPNWIAVLSTCCNSSLIFSGKCLSWRWLNAFVEPRLC